MHFKITVQTVTHTAGDASVELKGSVGAGCEDESHIRANVIRTRFETDGVVATWQIWDHNRSRL